MRPGGLIGLMSPRIGLGLRVGRRMSGLLFPERLGAAGADPEIEIEGVD